MDLVVLGVLNCRLAMMLLITFSVFPEVERKEDERAGSWELAQNVIQTEDGYTLFHRHLRIRGD